MHIYVVPLSSTSLIVHIETMTLTHICRAPHLTRSPVQLEASGVPLASEVARSGVTMALLGGGSQLGPFMYSEVGAGGQITMLCPTRLEQVTRFVRPGGAAVQHVQRCSFVLRPGPNAEPD